MVVGRSLRIEHLLTKLLIYIDLPSGKCDPPLLLRQNGQSCPPAETALRDIGVPRRRITGPEGAIEQLHQRVERNIDRRVRRPVVGDLQHERFEERVVRE